MVELSGVQLLEQMQVKGWCGAAILLTEDITPHLVSLTVNGAFVAMTPTKLANRPLLDAVDAATTGHRLRTA